MPDEADGRIALPIAGQQLTQIRIDHRLALLFQSGAELSISGNGSLTGAGRREDFAPERLVNVLAALALLWDSVVAAEATADGSVAVSFSKDRVLTVMPDPDYEAWEFVDGDGGLRLVSLPGGGLATWGLGG